MKSSVRNRILKRLVTVGSVVLLNVSLPVPFQSVDRCQPSLQFLVGFAAFPLRLRSSACRLDEESAPNCRKGSQLRPLTIRGRAGLVFAQGNSENLEPPAKQFEDMSAEEFLDSFEQAGAFEGEEELLAQLRLLAAKGIHPLEALKRSRALPNEEARARVLSSFDMQGIAEYVMENKCRRIVVMCGAGISTSSGIPDFRTPGTGLYDNLQKYNLSAPEMIFDLEYFRDHPGAFYELCKEMWPGNYAPSPTHYFIRLLSDKGVLLRCYSQNIDSLEHLAGLPAEKLVAAHGNFDAAHVIDSTPEEEVDISELKVAIDKGEPGWTELRQRKGGLVKPKIVFFGEQLPERFYELHRADLEGCDLLIVLGTSLVVQPFASLVGCANPAAPRLLINREPVGACETLRYGFRFHLQEEGQNWRDAWHEGDCDSGCRALAMALGWHAELETLIQSGGLTSAKRAPWVDP